MLTVLNDPAAGRSDSIKVQTERVICPQHRARRVTASVSVAGWA